MKFRPFTVKEEKLLLMASQSEETETINDTIKQILNNCIIDSVNIDDMPIFDVEYLFLNLRSKSVDNVVELKMKDEDDDMYYDVEIDLNDAVVEVDPDHTSNIKLNEDITITMKYPSFGMIETMSGKDQNDLVEIITMSIDKVVNGSEVMSLADYDSDEIKVFVESFTSKNMRDVEKFFSTVPRLKMDVTYITPNGPKKKEIVGLQSFFTS
jgi:hypothetical protein